MDIRLEDVTDEQFSSAELAVISALRAAYPNLDLRAGTVLRALLVAPDAALAASNSARVENLRASMSLKAIEESGTTDPEAVASLLSNFNIVHAPGVKAVGTVMVKVDANRTYTLGSGFGFTSLAGLRFETTGKIVAKVDAIASIGETVLRETGDGSWYFLADVAASEVGSQYNLQKGTGLSAASHLYGFVAAYAYSNFSSGTGAEDISGVRARIPVALSHRGMTNRMAMEAQLRDRFDSTSTPVVAVSVTGYGDQAMTRDRHNVFGVSVGGRADIYVRTSVPPHVSTYVKTGTRVGDGVYSISLSNAEAAGMYAVRSVSDANGIALGSYEFSEVRSQSGVSTVWHDIDPESNEHVLTKYQSSTITATGVNATAAEHLFAVDVYDMPGISAMQDFVDSDDIRSTVSDVLVKAPSMCLVGVSANVYHSPKKQLDIPYMTGKVLDYVNSRSFVDRLTRSEIAAVLLDAGATRVDMNPSGLRLTGRIFGLDRISYTLSGDSLNISDIIPGAGLAPATCVFGAEAGSVQLVPVAE